MDSYWVVTKPEIKNHKMIEHALQKEHVAKPPIRSAMQKTTFKKKFPTSIFFLLNMYVCIYIYI